MYGAVVLGDYLYVIGGYRDKGGFTTSVEKAPVNPDGTLGSWEQTTPLPAPRSYIGNQTVSLNDIVYVVGGLNGETDENQKTILWSRPRADGQLGIWQESAPCPGSGVSCSVALATPGMIHLIAGTVGSRTATPQVWSAKIDKDGAVTGWEQGPPLAQPLWYHSGGVVGGRAYIWGGLTGPETNTVHPNVYEAPILSSGRLGPWQLSRSKLPEGFYSATSTVSGSYLLAFCPRYAGSVVSDDVWYCMMMDGGLSNWTRISTKIPAKLYIGLATDYRNGVVYLPGGRRSKASYVLDDTVYYFPLTRQRTRTTPHSPPKTAQPVDSGIAKESRLSYLQQDKTSASAIPGFLPYEKARQQSMVQEIPIILYFHTDKEPLCLQQTQSLRNFFTQSYSGRIIFAEVEALHFPQITQQYGVSSVPYWIFFDNMGSIRLRKSGVIQLQELATCCQQILQ